MKLTLHRILFANTIVAAAALLVTGCGGGAELESAQSQITEFSNKLTKAESQIGDWERTSQTALTNLALAAADFASLSNRYVKLKGQLTEAEGRGSIAEAKVGQQALRIAELEAQQAETVTLINQLRSEKASTAERASEAQRQITEANSRVQAAMNEREILKAKLIELEHQMNNREWLSAQLSRAKAAEKVRNPAKPPTTAKSSAAAVSLNSGSDDLTASPRGETAMASARSEPFQAKAAVPKNAPLVMMPDGSVRPVVAADKPASQ